MSLFLSTCSVISSSVSLIAGVKQINAKVTTLLQPHKGLRISERDRRRLVSIHKRVECLIQPLNFCVMWSRERDSCIQTVIQYAYDLVHSVTDFLDKVKFVTDEIDPFMRILDNDSSQKVDHFLRELDFACSSVSMAVAISKSDAVYVERRQVSPSALLKASMRICEMTSRSGDLFAIHGSLYKREMNIWKVVSSDCTIKVSQFKAVDPSDSPYLIRLSPTESELGELNFPIHTALTFQATTAELLSLPVPSLIDSTALYWRFAGSDATASPTKRRLLHRNPSGEIDQDLSRLSLDSSDEEAFLVHGASAMPNSLRPRVSSTHISGPETAAEYAFTYAGSNLSPLDIVYITRLCVLEAIRQPISTSPMGDMIPSPRTNVIKALHLEASDETLTALLLDARLPHDSQSAYSPCESTGDDGSTLIYSPGETRIDLVDEDTKTQF